MSILYTLWRYSSIVFPEPAFLAYVKNGGGYFPVHGQQSHQKSQPQRHSQSHRPRGPGLSTGGPGYRRRDDSPTHGGKHEAEQLPFAVGHQPDAFPDRPPDGTFRILGQAKRDEEVSEHRRSA